MQHQIHPNAVRQVLLLLTIILMGVVISREMFFMLAAFLGAITIYVISRDFVIKLNVDYKWKKNLASLFIILVSFVLLVIPFVWLASVVVEKIGPYVQNTEQVTTYFQSINQYIIKKTGFEILSEKNIGMINSQLVVIAQKALGGTLSFFGTIAIMYLITYFLLTNIFDVEKWLRGSIPLKQANSNKIINEAKSSIYGSAVGIPIVAIGQGVIGMIGYFIFGSKEWFLLGLLTAIASVIPIVGAMLIYLPLGIYMLSIGNTFGGIGILIWGFVVIGSTDNLLRLYLQKQMNDVHPLITIFGAFIGVPMFGFLGVIFGPLLLSLFLILIKIYTDEFGKANV
jgi:predicted PurR-regulated permease PerM